MPRLKDDVKPRGRMTAYAFFLQTCRDDRRKNHPDEKVVFADFTRMCAARWKVMSERDKSRYQEMADRDKKRYKEEMQDYVPPNGEKGRGKKRRNKKDPNAPKKPLSSFMLFCKDERSKIKETNPELSMAEIAKELGRLWGHADPDTKRLYTAMAAREKDRYERQMVVFKKKGKTQPPAPVDHDGDDTESDEDE